MIVSLSKKCEGFPFGDDDDGGGGRWVELNLFVITTADVWSRTKA
jgi:hypothetical protein